MKNKILVFVICNRKLLALRNKPQDPKHGGDFWFTVTGEVEDNERYEDAVKREVKEETTLKTKEIINLNWASLYTSGMEKNAKNTFLLHS